MIPICTRARIQSLLEENLPRVLTLLILTYVEEREIRVSDRTWGKRGQLLGEFQYPCGINVLFNEVFIADTRNHRIQVFTPKGQFLRMWGKQGTGPGEFNNPLGISTLPNKVIVTDTYNHRMQVFTPGGQFLWMWGKYGTEPGELNCPHDVTSFSDEVFVADTRNHRIQVFTLNGRFLRMWGTSGYKFGELSSPCGITSSPRGEIFVTNTYRHDIQIFTPDGKFVRVLSSAFPNIRKNLPTYITRDEPNAFRNTSEEIVIVDTCNYSIQIFTSKGDFLRVLEKRKEGLGNFIYPSGIVSLPSGEVLIVDTYNHRICTFQTILD